MDRHHLLEIILWPREDGTFLKILNSMDKLKELGIYDDYKLCINISHSEHSSLHAKNRPDTTKSMWSKSHTGIERTKETKDKISKSMTGIKFSNEHKANLSKARKGKPQSEFGRKFFEHYNIISSDNDKLYMREKRYYQKHHKCSWE